MTPSSIENVLAPVANNFDLTALHKLRPQIEAVGIIGRVGLNVSPGIDLPDLRISRVERRRETGVICGPIKRDGENFDVRVRRFADGPALAGFQGRQEGLDHFRIRAGIDKTVRVKKILNTHDWNSLLPIAGAEHATPIIDDYSGQFIKKLVGDGINDFG